MRKEIIIDLHGVKSEIDVILCFAKLLNLRHGGLGWTKKNLPNWDAFSDDISDLKFPDVPANAEILLTVRGIGDVVKNIGESIYGGSVRDIITQILAHRTDPKERADRYNFLFKIYQD